MVRTTEPESSHQRAWLIRAGERGEAEELAIKNAVAVIGWSELGELSPTITGTSSSNAFKPPLGKNEVQA